MPVPRSPTLALALLGACLTACFTDDGAPALSTDPATTDASVGPTTADISTSTTTTEATTGDPTTGTPATTTEVSTTGCVPETWYFDIDKDGYGGPMKTEQCGSPGTGYTLDSLDCNDLDFDIKPGATEVCDTVDNDCDGGIDEYPAADMSGACNGCTAIVGPGSTYYLCDTPTRDWDGARAHCKTLLGDLVVIGDAMERAYLYGLFVAPGLHRWVGLGDLANEGQFVWVDGSSLNPDIPTWGPKEPDNVDADVVGPAHCVDMAPLDGWRDESCSDTHAFICEAPLTS